MKKQYIQIIGLAAALLLIVSLPAAFTKKDSGYRVGEIELFSVEADFFQKPKEEYNIWEQVKLIRDSSVVWESKLNDYIPESQIKETETELLQEMEVQLRIIQSYHGLPELTFSDMEHCVIKKATFMSTEHKKYAEVLDLWIIQAVYHEFAISVYMDCKTFALYDVSILSKNDDFVYPSDLTSDGFWEYLNAFSTFDGTNDDMFSAHTSYGAQGIHLHLWSENKTTHNTSMYCLHTAVDANTSQSFYEYEYSDPTHYIIVEQENEATSQ